MSNSGIDFTKKPMGPIYDEYGKIRGFLYYEVDHSLCKQAREELDFIDQNKGKFVAVYDDETGRQLTDLEVAEIEEQEALRLPFVIIEKEKDLTDLKKALIKQNRKHRKYKPKRIIVNPELKAKIYKKDQNKCRICENVHGVEIAHIDRDPSHTWESNLMLLCSECHLTYDKKKKYRYKDEQEDV